MSFYYKGIRNLPLNFIQFVTKHPRYRPTNHWDKRIWVANLFRLYEFLFGRAEGIKAEVASYAKFDKGIFTVKYRLFTLEAVVVHVEVLIRTYLSLFRSFFSIPQPKLDYRPVYLTFGIFTWVFSLKTSMHLLPLFGLAIAHDADSNSGIQTTATSYSWNHTCTGSNLCLVLGFAIRPAGTDATANYNSVATSAIRTDSNGNRVTRQRYLLSPSTGSNSIAATISGSVTQSDGHAISLSGVNALDNNNGANSASSSAPSVSVTTIADNCFVTDILCTGVDDGVATPGGSQTLASKVANTGAHTGAQSYTTAAVHPAGATTMSWTTTSSNYALSAASFSPFVASAVNLGTNRLLTGVGT